MQATRTLQQRALSRLVQNTAQASHNGVFLRAAAKATAPKAVVPAASRAMTTQSLSVEENLKLLNQQRAVRPSSPHFTIYEPQLGWISSIATRITGSGLSVGLYGFACAYAAAPLVGMGFTAQSCIALVASWPIWLKASAKVILATPFVYHSLAGIRHLAWDMGYGLSLKTAWASGWAMVASSAVISAYLAFLV